MTVLHPDFVAKIHVLKIQFLVSTATPPYKEWLQERLRDNQSESDYYRNREDLTEKEKKRLINDLGAEEYIINLAIAHEE